MDKFQVGDVVEVLPPNQAARLSWWASQMDDMIGKEFPIVRVYENKYYLEHPKGIKFYFYPEFLELAKEKTYKQLYNLAKIRAIPNRSKMNKEQLKQAIQEWKEPVPLINVALRNAVGDSTPCANYAFEYEDGTRDVNHYTPCHAGCNYIPKKVVAAVEDIKAKYEKHEDKETYKTFINYMMNGSPWKNCFITKDATKGIEEGVFFNVEEGHSRVVNAMVAMRQGFEHRERLLGPWKYLINLGYSENVSWACAQFLRPVDEKYFMKRVPDGCHDAFTGNIRFDNYIRFFKEGFFIPSERSFKDAVNHRYDQTFAIDGRSEDNYDNDLANNTLYRTRGMMKSSFIQKKDLFSGNMRRVEIVEEKEIISFADKMKKLIEGK